jgi:hypothetical protein
VRQGHCLWSEETQNLSSGVLKKSANYSYDENSDPCYFSEKVLVWGVFFIQFEASECKDHSLFFTTGHSSPFFLSVSLSIHFCTSYIHFLIKINTAILYIITKFWKCLLFCPNRVPILVAFYDMHGLQWDYSFPPSPHGEHKEFSWGKSPKNSHY